MSLTLNFSTYSATFMTFAIACSLAYFWSTYFVPETANVSLEEIDAVFRTSAGQEDAQLKREVSAHQRSYRRRD